jgi:SAM-dependent methyltransferase
LTGALMQVEPRVPRSAPFDPVAEQYDATFSSSIIGRLQREVVWDELGKSFHRGNRILDIGCGTGVDARFLAEKGMHVVACDSSAQMLRVAEQKLSSLPPTGGSIQFRFVAAEAISTLVNGSFFDGALSNFGAVNCVADLAKLARDLALLLRPGAPLFLCLIGPACAWETVWYLLQGKPGKAFRRFHRDGVPAKLEGGDSFDVFYPSVRSIQSAFAPHFQLRSIRGIGIAVPPSYLEPWARRFPNRVRLCAKADRYLSSCPGVRGLADHVLLRFERADAPLAIAPAPAALCMDVRG